MTAAQAAENHGDKWGLTWYLQERYTSIPTWTHSQISLAAAKALSLKISLNGTGQVGSTDRQISKKRCFEEYCSYDQVWQFSALQGTSWRSYLENLTIDDKFTNK